MKDREYPIKRKRIAIAISLLSLVTVTAIGVSIWALFFREPDVILSPDYAPQETEVNAEKVPNDGGDKMDTPEGGGAVSLTYSDQVSIDISQEKAYLLFVNPGKSTQDMILQIVIQGEVVVQSGRLTPGHRVTTLDLLPKAVSKLAPGGYNAKFVVFYYDKESGEKAIVNTEIPIHITVKA